MHLWVQRQSKAASFRERSLTTDRIFQFLADPANRATLTPAVIEAAYAMEPGRARRELPYVVAAPLAGIASSQSSIAALDQRGESELFPYDAMPLLLARTVHVPSAQRSSPALEHSPADTRPDTEALDYGLDSFVPTMKAAGYAPYALVCGDPDRLPVAELQWRPGAQRPDDFHQPGVWGFAWTPDTLPEAWQPVTQGPVFAFSEPSSAHPQSVDWTVGTADALDFLRDAVWYGFAPDEDAAYEPQEECYRNGCQVWLRQLLGGCVPHAFTCADLRAQLRDPESPVELVRFHYPPAAADTPPPPVPCAITVTNRAGETRELRLVD